MRKACGFKCRRLFCKGKVIDRKFRYIYNMSSSLFEFAQLIIHYLDDFSLKKCTMTEP